MNTKVNIVATIGPACLNAAALEAMARAGMSVARFNFAWGTVEDFPNAAALVRAAAQAAGSEVRLMADLPGPRVQEARGHTYDPAVGVLTSEDEEVLRVAVAAQLEYVALSFVGSAADLQRGRAALASLGGAQKLIAKIERKAALEHLDEIIGASDAVMVARGDLGNEVPLEEIPFIEKDIIARCKAAGTPVIVATQMMLSMVKEKEPTRAEVTDVEEAVALGADAVMLSEETAAGAYPVEAVAMMERIITAAESHLPGLATNPL
jgi:pyruvate kinase